jgi:hypothetical protein
MNFWWWIFQQQIFHFMVVSLTFVLVFNLVNIFYINDSIVTSPYSTCWSHMICYNPCMDLSTIASFKIILFLVQKLNSLQPFLVLLKPTNMHLVFQGINFIHWFSNTCIYANRPKNFKWFTHGSTFKYFSLMSITLFVVLGHLFNKYVVVLLAFVHKKVKILHANTILHVF